MQVRYLTYLFISLLLFQNCVDEVPIDISNFEEEIDVVGNFQPGEYFTIEVTKTYPLNANGPNGIVVNALVQISENGTLYPLELIGTNGEGIAFYENHDLIAKPGFDYDLQVYIPPTNNLPPLGPATASAKLPSLTILPTASITKLDSSANQITATIYELEFEIDLAATSDLDRYYHVTSLFEQVLVFLSPGNPTIIDTSNIKIGFDINNISAPGLVPHFEDGYLINMTEFAANGGKLNVQTTFSVFNNTEEFNKVLVEVRTVSEEYFQHHLTRSIQANSIADPLAEPVFIYDNIENGIGDFSGFIPTIIEIDFD